MNFTEKEAIYSHAELERMLIYSIIVAGKSANFADTVMSSLFPLGSSKLSPFEELRSYSPTFRLWLFRSVGTGNYTKLHKAIGELLEADLDLWTCTPEDLEKIHGIGPKTARFFILWTRPNARYAALDVHVLRWLREVEGHKDCPKATPQNPKEYKKWEDVFLGYADAAGVTPRQLDWEIWSAGSGYTGNVQSE